MGEQNYLLRLLPIHHLLTKYHLIIFFWLNCCYTDGLLNVSKPSELLV